jgi:hypothetical protein
MLTPESLLGEANRLILRLCTERGSDDLRLAKPAAHLAGWTFICPLESLAHVNPAQV